MMEEHYDMDAFDAFSRDATRGSRRTRKRDLPGPLSKTTAPVVGAVAYDLQSMDRVKNEIRNMIGGECRATVAPGDSHDGFWVTIYFPEDTTAGRHGGGRSHPSAHIILSEWEEDKESIVDRLLEIRENPLSAHSDRNLQKATGS